MTARIHLASALLVRDREGASELLLVASHYVNHPEPLWNLPGGRQQHGELLEETVVREVREETGLRVAVTRLAYVSESYDGDVHFLNATFCVECAGGVDAPLVVPDSGDHVESAAWVPVGQLESRIAIAVVRRPLVAYLRGELKRSYLGFHEAGVTIRWPNDPS